MAAGLVKISGRCPFGVHFRSGARSVIHQKEMMSILELWPRLRDRPGCIVLTISYIYCCALESDYVDMSPVILKGIGGSENDSPECDMAC